MTNELITATQLASVLGCSRATVYRYTQRGIFPHIKLPMGIRFRKEDIEAFLTASRIDATEPACRRGR